MSDTSIAVSQHMCNRVAQIARDVVVDVIADHPMWIGDDGQPLDYLPAREAMISNFVEQVRFEVAKRVATGQRRFEGNA